MNTKVYSKEAEIKAIEKLIEMGGYFAECFGGDLEKMSENINNDFPIELDTRIMNHVEHRKQLCDNKVAEYAHRIAEICDTMLCAYGETGSRQLYDRAVQELGRKNVIARKRILGLKITDDEIDYILSQLKNDDE
jgi:hypothetical protein